MEEWRPIPDFPGYEVSSLGRVKSSRRGTPKVLSTKPGSNGYPQMTLMRNKRRYQRHMHEVVTGAFIGPRPEGLVVRHLDGDPANNRIDNLAYGTQSENAHDAIEHGTHHHAGVTKCPSGHEYTPGNTRLDKNGYRFCRECKRESDRTRRANRTPEQRAATNRYLREWKAKRKNG